MRILLIYKINKNKRVKFTKKNKEKIPNTSYKKYKINIFIHKNKNKKKSWHKRNSVIIIVKSFPFIKKLILTIIIMKLKIIKLRKKKKKNIIK